VSGAAGARRAPLLALLPALAAGAAVVASMSGSQDSWWAPSAMPSAVLAVCFVFLWRLAVIPAALVAAALTLVWCWPLAHGEAAIGRRSLGLLWALAAASLLFFGLLAWRDDLVDGSAPLVAAAFDVAWLGGAVLLGRRGARAPSPATSCAYHAVLFGGLFWCGFPLMISKSFTT
jgi:hypothetical protein